MLPFIIVAEAKRKMKPVFVGAVVLLAIGEILLGSGYTSRTWFLFGLFVFFMAFNLLEATLPSLVSKIAPAGGKGTAMGIYSTSQFLGTFLGGVTGGLVAHHYGYAQVFLMVAALILVWIIAAATMEPPRHLKSLVVKLLPNDQITIDRYVGPVPGVCDVVVMPEQQLAYFKVDMDEFSPEVMQQVLGRPV
jgi:MFS family permease